MIQNSLPSYEKLLQGLKVSELRQELKTQKITVPRRGTGYKGAVLKKDLIDRLLGKKIKASKVRRKCSNIALQAECEDTKSCAFYDFRCMTKTEERRLKRPIHHQSYKKRLQKLKRKDLLRKLKKQNIKVPNLEKPLLKKELIDLLILHGDQALVPVRHTKGYRSIKKLKKEIKRNRLELPTMGTGKGGRVLRQDLINILEGRELF